jgi:NADH-quinone oxidoreductase subunit B
VQGVDHVVPVDMYLPGCPPRPEMLTDAILKLHHKIMNEPLGPKRARELERAQQEGRAKELYVEMPSSVRVDKQKRAAYERAAAERRTGQFAIEQRGGNAVLLPEPYVRGGIATTTAERAPQGDARSRQEVSIAASSASEERSDRGGDR